MLRPIATATFLLAFPLTLACGLSLSFGDDEDEALRAYFEEVRAAKHEHNPETGRDLNVSEDELVVRLLIEQNEVLAALLERLEAIEAPLAVEEAHANVTELTRRRLTVQMEIAQNYVIPGRLNYETGRYQDQAVERREEARLLWYSAVCELELQSAERGVSVDLGCSPLEALAMRPMQRETIDLPTGPEACGQASAPRKAAIANGQFTFVHWFNRRGEPVRLHSIEQHDEPTLVATLPNDGDSVQVTLIGVGWLVTDEQDNCIGGYFPGWPAVNVAIK